MRARAIEDLLEYRKPRESTSFKELGQRPPLAGGEMRALASALSGMSASAGTFGGVTPSNQGFQEGLRALADYERQKDDQLLSNIKVSGLADEERRNQERRAKPLDPMTRSLLQQRISSLPIPQTEMIEIPPTMTFGDLEDNPVLQSLSQDITRTGKSNVEDEIARAQELRLQQKRRQPMSDEDRAIVNKYLERLGLSYQFPPGTTYGEVDDNEYLRPLLKNMKGIELSTTLSPRQEQQMRVTEEREARAKREEQRKIKREDKREAKEEKEETRKLSSQILGSGLQTAWVTMKEIEKAMPPVGQDIPGFGATGFVPMFALSKEGKKLRTAFQNLLNVTLKDRSGAAVTPPEFERLKVELGNFAGATDEDFRNGIRRAKKALEETTKAILAGYPPEAYEKYKEQGGRDFRAYLSENSRESKTQRREWTP